VSPGLEFSHVYWLLLPSLRLRLKVGPTKKFGAESVE
jgi:hypothetical protein